MITENKKQLKVNDDLDISVLIPTYNRKDILNKTLQSMTQLDCDGLKVEIVIVDNNSCDETKEVIASFTGKLPIRYLFEAKAGKSCALNRVLNEVRLGKIIVFTDDDIVPDKSWLRAIVAVSDRWPDYSVFGGKIDLIWPEGEVAGWAKSKAVQFWAFGHHDQGDSDTVYPERKYPGGANFWVRRKAFCQGIRFDEFAGPRPANFKVMGAETSLLHKLVLNGYEIMYSPDAVVGHYVQKQLLSERNIKKRAFRWGRQMPHRGICHRIFFEKHPLIWRFLRVISLVRHAIKYAVAKTSFSHDMQVVRSLDSMTRMGYEFESLKISYENTRGSKF